MAGAAGVRRAVQVHGADAGVLVLRCPEHLHDRSRTAIEHAAKSGRASRPLEVTASGNVNARPANGTGVDETDQKGSSGSTAMATNSSVR